MDTPPLVFFRQKWIRPSKCDTVSFVHDLYFSEHVPSDHDETIEPRRVIYPPLTARRLPDWLSQIDADLRSIMEETYTALQAGSNRLAAMGARAALEYLMLSKINDQSSFRENINTFIEEGHMQSSLKQPFNDALDVGSASIHRNFVPSDEQLSELVDVLEGLVVSTLIVPTKAKNIRNATPTRSRNTRNSKK